jgi:hypothetical protein
MAWPDVIPIALQDFEAGDDELEAAKTNRSLIEYYFTCTPSLPAWILRKHPAIDLITYVDSDLFFFDSPEPVFEEMGNDSIAIIEHRFDRTLKRMEETGIYNVGWLSFRNNAEGLRCLQWWRQRCLEWCFDHVEPDRYADQKYLDRFPGLFDAVRVIRHKGANVAAWNLRNYRLHETGGAILVDDQPLLFYHFQGFRRAAPGVVDPGVRQYGLRVSRFMERRLFRPYIQELIKARAHISRLFGRDTVLFGALHRKLSVKDRGPAHMGRSRKVIRFCAAYCRVFTRHFLWVRNHIG